MDSKTLERSIESSISRSVKVLLAKNKKYSPNADRLENFKQAGAMDSVSPEDALWGMLRKHLTSLSMMCRDLTAGINPVPVPIWEEKLTDSINYLFLLEALVKERYGAC